MFKKIKLILLVFLLYQTPLFSKSNSFNDFDSENLSKYFSGLVAFENKDNSAALDFFNSSKDLMNKHDPYLKKYIYSLVLENKISKAINIVKSNKDKGNTNFFDAHLLLVIDSLKKDNINQAYFHLINTPESSQVDKISSIIFENLKQYIYVFKEKKFLDNPINFGKLSLISETFQKCYLGDSKTDTFFLNIINDPKVDYSRYVYFYLTYLIENLKIDKAKKIVNNINYINTTLLLSQAKVG